MTRAPTIGSYRRETKEGSAPVEMVERKKDEATPARALSTGIEEDLKDSVNKTKGNAEKAKTYEELLADKDIPLQKAHAVVDALLEKGHYDETYEIKLPTRTPITVTFRTRAHSDYLRFLRALEAHAPRYVDEQREIQARYFLAASLVAFRGHVFRREVTSDENASAAFEERLDWIEAQPERIINLLTQKLHEFDVMVNTIMSEGLVENF
jgi:hypothetical protein